MNYNFDELIPRRGTNSLKWDSSDDADVLPLWVADMDFRTAQPIIDALQKRVAHGIFGYTHVPDEYYNAIINWFDRRHGWEIKRDWMIYTSGIVPAISAILQALTLPGDKVMVQGPVYNCFYSSIRNSGCVLISNSLVREGNTYRIDFDDMEQKIIRNNVTVFLMCNPHNPAGRVWTRNELQQMGEICMRHNVTVISDEIHCEFVYSGYNYTPFASISDEFARHSISCISPSKTFNIAGLQIANIVTANDAMRRRIDRTININEICDVNPFGVTATIAAYSQSGEEWLNQLLQYMYGNYEYLCKYCAEHLPQFPIMKLEGTYLPWMDCSSLHIPVEALEEELIKHAKVWLNAGSMYGAEGEGYLRWNIACPRTILSQALERFNNAITKL